ncbi:hypothetical protein [Streptomyces sp. CB02261]|uniref:hypothetical protein n=1 Tax=Streptomyces sp. CB02261 TaxID=1703940 RepID=UPI000940008A|nr:hypothetical protein [Streptomyces sp. CB02261]OKJ52555.1 hypothetical protein AMK29_30485 [Streptomyces sp. CB02261]
MSQGNPLSPSPVPLPDVFSEALRRVRTDRVVRPVRRTLAEMAPGYTRQPVLRLVPAAPGAASDAPCLFCDQWLCPGNCQNYVPAPASVRTAVKAVA